MTSVTELGHNRMGFGLLSAAGLQFRLTKMNSGFNGERCDKKMRADPSCSCSCSDRRMSVSNPQQSCAAVLAEGEPRHREKVLFLCQKEEKLQKGGNPMPGFALNRV